MRSLVSVTVISALAAAPGPTFAAEETSALGVVRGLIEAIRAFEGPKDGESLSSIQEQKNQRTVERAHAALDFEGLARRSLATTWDRLDPKGRAAFVSLLKRLFAEVAYPNSSEFFGSLDLEIEDGGARKDRHVIEVAVSHPDEGLVDLEFFLGEVDGRWKVVDLHLDGVSLALDIRAQMQRIIKEDGYEALVERMKKKLADEGVTKTDAKASAPEPK
jgi:phospholipid transport system substrate-binding protein